jgi:hypothetical protein
MLSDDWIDLIEDGGQWSCGCPARNGCVRRSDSVGERKVLVVREEENS